MLTSALSQRYTAMVDAKTESALVLKDGIVFNNYYEGDAESISQVRICV